MDSNPLQIEYDSSTQTLTLTTPMNHRIIIRESSDSLLIQDSHQNQLTLLEAREEHLPVSSPPKRAHGSPLCPPKLSLQPQ